MFNNKRKTYDETLNKLVAVKLKSNAEENSVQNPTVLRQPSSIVG